jgi:CPA1 family monovalent cation:H+ antiporter
LNGAELNAAAELVLLLMICAVALGWLARHYNFPTPLPWSRRRAAGRSRTSRSFRSSRNHTGHRPADGLPGALLTSGGRPYPPDKPVGHRSGHRHHVAVGSALKFMVPSIPWAAAFVLGAIVSPPDAVAATTILSRLKIPRHLVTILEGESLVNDASGLVIYKLAIAAVLTGAFSFADATTQFVLVSVGGDRNALECSLPSIVACTTPSSRS